MARKNLNDLLGFVTVAREGSFTRAAATLGCDPVGPEPVHPRPGGAAADPAADADDAQRVDDRCRRAPGAGHRAPLRRDRVRARCADGDAGQACGDGAHHLRRPRSAQHPAAQADAGAARIPGNHAGVRRELRLSGHRGGPLRRWRAHGQHHRQGHDRRPHRSAAANGSGRFTGAILRATRPRRSPRTSRRIAASTSACSRRAGCTSGTSSGAAAR